MTVAASAVTVTQKPRAVRAARRATDRPNGHAPAVDPRAFLAERLELSGIAAEEGRYAGILAMTVAEARRQGYELPGNCTDGFVLPYHDAKGAVRSQMWRWRNNPALVKGFAKLTDDPLSGLKYVQPHDTDCEVYWPRVQGLNWEKLLADPKIPVVVVEGELKALCLCLRGVAAVGLGGVWSFTLHKQLLPALAKLAAGREVWIAFDSDTEDKPMVTAARSWLAKALTAAGATVRILVIPPLRDKTKTGVDDWCCARPKLREQALREALLELEDEQEFALAAELYRLNTAYVINRENGRIHSVTDINKSWDDQKFVRLIENGTIAARDRKGNETPKSASKEWIMWPLRNVVEGQAYVPMAQTISQHYSRYVYVEGQRMLNNWQGWASVPAHSKRGEGMVRKFWTALLDHHFRQQRPEDDTAQAQRLLCRRWFEQWWAYAVQNPGMKMHSCTVLQGWPGGGKGLVGYMVRAAVYGRHFREVTQKDLEGAFNASYSEAVGLLMGSEITTKTTRIDMSEWFKNFITADTLRVNRKHVPDYFMENRINAYFTTNYEDSFFLDDNDRRYFLWAIPPVRLDQHKEFGPRWIADCVAAMKDTEFCAALHWHLLNLDISGFDHSRVPDSPAKQVAVLFSHNAGDSFITDFIERKTEQASGKSVVPTVFSFHEAYESFKAKHPQFGEKAFLKAWRKRFDAIGRVRLVFIDGHGVRDKVKTALWTYRPDFTRGKVPDIITIEAAKRQYIALNSPRVAEPTEPKPRKY